MSNVVMRRATECDIAAIASINARVFLGDRDKIVGAQEWVGTWFRAYPLYQYFVVEVDGACAGYAGWQMHGGFHRAEPVIELDQVGIDPKYQGQQLAPQLISYSIKESAALMRQKNDRIESHISFVVWVYTFNQHAMKVYAQIFTEGACGFRLQFGNRAETMLRLRLPVVMPVRAQ